MVNHILNGEVNTFSISHTPVRYIYSEVDNCPYFYIDDLFKGLKISTNQIRPIKDHLHNSNSVCFYTRNIQGNDDQLKLINPIGVVLVSLISKIMIEFSFKHNQMNDDATNDLFEVNKNLFILNNTHPELCLPKMMSEAMTGTRAPIIEVVLTENDSPPSPKFTIALLKRFVPFALDYHENLQPKSIWQKLTRGKTKVY